jgi:predicted peptidase
MRLHLLTAFGTMALAVLCLWLLSPRGKESHKPHHPAPPPLTRHTEGYDLYMPDHRAQLPLVVLLPDAGDSAGGTAYFSDAPAQEANPAILVIPTGNWEGEEKSGSLVKMVKDAALAAKADMTRIYIVGCGAGGTGVYSALRYHPDLFAAGISVSGVADPALAPMLTKVPLSILAGSLDYQTRPDAARQLALDIQSGGGRAYYTEHTDLGHDCAAPRYYAPVLLKWLFAQKRPG